MTVDTIKYPLLLDNGDTVIVDVAYEYDPGEYVAGLPPINESVDIIQVTIKDAEVNLSEEQNKLLRQVVWSYIHEQKRHNY